MDHFVKIYDWMLELGLNGRELNALAVVYSFGKGGEWFQGSASYLGKWMGVKRKHTVLDALSSLVNKGLIEKRERWENGQRLCDYRPVRTSHHPGANMHHPGAYSAPGAGAKTSLHNNRPDNDTIVSDRDNRARVRVGHHGARFQEVWDKLLRQPGWSCKSNEALDECLTDLELVPEEVAVEMMRNSIKNGWKGLFPLERKPEIETESPIAAAERLEREAYLKMKAYAAENTPKS